MKIALIGSGNVATVLGRLMVSKQHTVVQVMSRDIKRAQMLASEFGAAFSDFTGNPSPEADIFILAVADQALEHLFGQQEFGNKLVLHTAGSVSIDVLKKMSANYGVLYPLQSLRKEMKLIPPIPFLVDGNSADVLLFVEAFARSISESVKRVGDDERLKLHTAAVVVSNFTNHLYVIAEEFCEREAIDFKILQPLILETAYRVQSISPSKVQTGPAVRRDVITIEKHLRILAAHPKMHNMYLQLTDSIMNA
jgi:predicted short-subunit dehydrogenase-like oxidoreductase (DUF2520 family)